MSKHTPGPWHVVLSDNATPHILHEHGCDSTDCNDLSSMVCVMPAEIVDDYNSLANARLIAAAPELLEALRSAISAFEEIQGGSATDRLICLGESGRARAAIRKALGEE